MLADIIKNIIYHQCLLQHVEYTHIICVAVKSDIKFGLKLSIKMVGWVCCKQCYNELVLEIVFQVSSYLFLAVELHRQKLQVKNSEFLENMGKNIKCDCQGI